MLGVLFGLDHCNPRLLNIRIAFHGMSGEIILRMKSYIKAYYQNILRDNVLCIRRDYVSLIHLILRANLYGNVYYLGYIP